MTYSEYILGTYEEDIARYPELERQIERQKGLILEKPYYYSHGLGQGKWRNLKGLRSAHMRGGKYVFIIAICEDCIRNGHMQLNSKYCGDICEQKELKRVVFIAFGKHDIAYGRL